MNTQINPYGQHFRCAARLFQNPAINDVFMFLLDEYMCQLRKNPNSKPTIQTSISEISRKTCVARLTIRKILSILRDMGVLLVDDDKKTLNINYYVGVVTLYNQQKTIEEQDAVANAFINGDVEYLRKLGLDEDEAWAEEILLDQRGSLDSELKEIRVDSIQKTKTDLSDFSESIEILKLTFKQFESSEQLTEFLSHFVTDPSALLDIKKFAELYVNFDNLLKNEQEKCLQLLIKISCNIIVGKFHKNFANVTNTLQQDGKNLPGEQENCSRVVNIYQEGGKILPGGGKYLPVGGKYLSGGGKNLPGDGKNLPPMDSDENKSDDFDDIEDDFDASGVVNIYQEGGKILPGGGKYLPVGWSNFTTRNKEIKEIKKMKEPKENENEKNESENEIKQNFEKIKNFEENEQLKNFSENKIIDNEELEPMPEPFRLKNKLEIINLSGPTITPEKKQIRKAATYPSFSVEEIDRIINDLEYAASDSLKLFINTVWYILAEHLDNGYEEFEEDDDYGNSQPLNLKIDGYSYPMKDFNDDILYRAYSEVQEIIEAGFLDSESLGEVEITFSEIFPRELIGEIFRWERHTLSYNEPVQYVISKNGIRNVMAEKVEKANKPVTREEIRTAKKDSLQFMSKIYLMNKNGKSSEFTPLEKIIAYCIETLLTAEPLNGGVYNFDINRDSQWISSECAVVKSQWRLIKARLAEVGISQDEFVECLLGNNKPNLYEQLTIQPCMFFAEGVRAMNKVKGFVSVVDEYSLESLGG